MWTVGVAGPAGSGKSTVCRMLARRPGVAHVDCDQLAWATYRPGGPAYAQLVAQFGEGVLRPDGAVNRARLARSVLADPMARAALEDIVHPRVVEAVRRRAEGHRRAGTRWLLVEGALLVSSRHVPWGEFDAFAWLAVPEEERRRRLLAAGLPPDQVEVRLAAQRDLVPPKDPKVHLVDGCAPPAKVADRLLALLQAMGGSSPPD
ncbi:MAG: dephospho-CoA kinase [Candidatus Bipolaricaulaceae bacterium]